MSSIKWRKPSQPPTPEGATQRAENIPFRGQRGERWLKKYFTLDMTLVVLDDNEATIIWTGSHDEYNLTFKGNKQTIEGWLRKQGLIK